jgi:hypothetical protein
MMEKLGQIRRVAELNKQSIELGIFSRGIMRILQADTALLKTEPP